MKVRLAMLVALAMVSAACSSGGGSGGGSSEDEISADKPSTVASAMNDKIGEITESLSEAMSGARRFSKSENGSMNVDMDCSEKGTPVALDGDGDPVWDETTCYGVDGIAQNADDLGYWNEYEDTPFCAMNSSKDIYYSARSFYCLIGKNTGSPDSLQGAIQMIEYVSCAVEKAGATFSTGTGSAQSVTIPFSKISAGGCFPDNMINEICAPDASCSKSANVTAIKSPTAHSGYDTYMKIEIPDIEVDVTFKVKVDGDIIEIANLQKETENREDAYAVRFNDATKVFSYEGRFDRLDCPLISSCGWSRHYRLAIDLDESAGELIPVSAEGVISDLYRIATDGNDDDEWDLSEVTGYTTKLVTIKGSLEASATGLTGQVLERSVNETPADETEDETYLSAAINKAFLSFVEYNGEQAACFPPMADPTEGACAGVTPVSVPVGVIGFFLAGELTREATDTNVQNKHLGAEEWFSALTGLNLTTVDMTDVNL